MSKPKKVINIANDVFIEVYGVAKDNSSPFIRICIRTETVGFGGEHIEKLASAINSLLPLKKVKTVKNVEKPDYGH